MGAPGQRKAAVPSFPARAAWECSPGLLPGKGSQVAGAHFQVATVRGILCPSGPPPLNAFCKAAGKGSWTLELTSPGCLGPQGRDPQTQKAPGFQFTWEKASREADKDRGRLGGQGCDTGGGRRAAQWLVLHRHSDACAETGRASGPGCSPGTRLGPGS